MGEYIAVDGIGQIKLGTMESPYYVRYTDLAQWVREGRAHRVDGNLEPETYLDGAFRFRFPFPDEDADDEKDRLARYDLDYWRGITVQVIPEMIYPEAAHGHISHWLRPHDFDGWQGGVQHTFPCPQGPEPDPQLEDRRFLSIMQQRPVDGRLWTVVRCGYCEALWRLDADSALQLADHIKQTRPELRELARRIMAGYADGVLQQDVPTVAHNGSNTQRT